MEFIISIKTTTIITMNTTADDKFKQFLRDEYKKNPTGFTALATKASKTMENEMKLNDKTLSFVMEQYSITKLQAEDLWNKLTSFNKILVDKYGDTYLENANTICVLTQQYKEKLIKTYKK